MKMVGKFANHSNFLCVKCYIRCCNKSYITSSIVMHTKQNPKKPIASPKRPGIISIHSTIFRKGASLLPGIRLISVPGISSTIPKKHIINPKPPNAIIALGSHTLKITCNIVIFCLIIV